MSKRRRRRRPVRYSGQVQRVGGPEGQRVQAELAAVVRDLLVWAAEHRDNPATARDQAQRDQAASGRGAAGDERSAA